MTKLGKKYVLEILQYSLEEMLSLRTMSRAPRLYDIKL
jgi:hypothetical protein